MQNSNRANKKPLVSVITVVLNGEKHLEQTIQSVASQSYDRIEYIVVDGGSTDGTIDIIKKNEGTITQWSSEKDRGLYDAMNKGIRQAKGELISLLNSDDWYEPHAVETMVEAYLNHPDKEIFHADRFDVDSEGNRRVYKYNPSFMKLKYYDMTYNHSTMFITSREYSRRLYNPDLSVLSDYQWMLQANLEDRNKFQYIEKTITNYRLEGASTQIPLGRALKEGFVARRLAGMPLYQNLISYIIRCNIPVIRHLGKKRNTLRYKSDRIRSHEIVS